jgi:P27 family predicted phage terminase small subunit
MRGRKPIPSNVHALRGNPGRRPLKENLKPPAAIPQCPDFLSPIARTEWQRITEQLSALGLVSELDRAALAAYCVAYGRWVEAEERLRQFGPIYKSPKTGQLTQNPFLRVANNAMAQMCRLLVEFGMTPSSRMRINIDAATAGVHDPASLYFND